jgi:hypothetical protein
LKSPHWPTLLDAYVESTKARAFEWGRLDCVTFAANWRAVASGSDPIAQWRGTYTTERQALELIVKLGCKDLESLATRLFGEPDPLGPKFAGRGDIVFAQGALGISLGARGAFLSLDGLAFLPARDFKTVWKVV